MIDTHCHLDAAEFDADREAVVERARQARVAAIVVPAIERANFGTVASICREYPLCAPAYGIHPLYVERAQEEDLDVLAETLQRGPAVAVGEIGLDFYVPGQDGTRQEVFFAEQLKIARRLGLPVLLHVRKAIDVVLKHLRRIRVVGGVAHAFNGSRQQADEFAKLGFKLGFGGAMTPPRAAHLRELAATLPAELVVLETDAPDIPPAWLASGARNEPAELGRIAAVMAELRGIDVAELTAITSANARQAFPGLPV
jgi:TatD DNase family protein